MGRYFAAIAFLIFATACSDRKPREYGIIPTVKKERLRNGNSCFYDSLLVYTEPRYDSLYVLLKEEFSVLFNLRLIKARRFEIADMYVEEDKSENDPEAYSVDINENKVRIKAASYEGAAMASVSLMQAMRPDKGGVCIRNGTITDKPDLAYRGLMIDLARKKHGIESIKQIIKLCRWYKINFIQLHLTDDQAFTFPSAAYPQLVTAHQHYTVAELNSLVEYARSNGIELVPEIDMPGHAGQFIEKMPELFGFENSDLNQGTLNMSNEKVYEVLDTIIGELANVFKYSRYIHIGGDEAGFEGMDDDPGVQSYLLKKKLSSVEELYWTFINRMNSFVRKRNRSAIVWEGFPKAANHLIDKNITVMAWETMYQLPQDLLAAGFKVINVSWKPLYVVNERKWDPALIYEWNPYRWENWLDKAPSFTPISIKPHDHLIGGSMASWDQPEYTELSSLRRRLPAMAENLWNTEKTFTTAAFIRLLNVQNRNLSNFLSPIRFSSAGLNHPNIDDGRYDQQTWFDDSLRFTLSAPSGMQIRYTLNGPDVTHISTLYTAPVLIRNSALLKYRAYAGDGQPIGTQTTRFFDLRPLHVRYVGDFLVHPDSVWSSPDNWLLPYSGSVVVTIRAAMPGELLYSISKNGREGDFIPYSRPIVLTETNIVKVEARLYRTDSLIGKPWMQHFKRIK